MKRINRLFSLAIAFIVLCTVLYVPNAQAVSSNFVVKDGVLINYSGNDATDVTIPGDLGITAIGRDAFAGYYEIKKITIPIGVKTIGDASFAYCSSLSSVSMPEGVTTLGKYVFLGCSSLKSIHLPDSIISIGAETFVGTSITEPIFIDAGTVLCHVPVTFANYTFPSTVIKINGGAFDGCVKLTSITIPEGVVEIGDYAFANCINLGSITIPKSVISVGTGAFSSTKLPAAILVNDGSILCYVPKGVSSYTIPNTVTAIAGGAFLKCSKISTLAIPEGVISIGDLAFLDCVKMTKVIIPKTVASVGFGAFLGTSIATPIYINDGKILCYVSKNVSSFTIPKTVTLINGGAFLFCNKLKTISIPSNVMTIGEEAFGRCGKLTSVSISNGVTSIGEYAFAVCDYLRSIFIPDSVTSIGQDAFVASYVTIYGEKSAYIKKFAKEIDFPYVSIPAFSVTTTYYKVLNNEYVDENVNVVPYGFDSTSYTINGKQAKRYHPASGVFSEDGKYVIKGKAGATTKTFAFTVDKTAPKIIVKSSAGKVVKKNASITGTARISITEKNISSKTIKFNGKAFKWPSTGKVKVKGSYSIYIYDKAGNHSTFVFKIK